MRGAMITKTFAPNFGVQVFVITTWTWAWAAGNAKCQVNDLAFSVVAPTGFEPALPP
jgi:hypothetical protein